MLTDRAPFPHCDERVLHAPGECRYCDFYPEAQRARVEAGANFTGHGLDLATAVRPLETVNRWPGNRPRPPAIGVHTFDRVGDKTDLKRIIFDQSASVWVCCRCQEVRAVFDDGTHFPLNFGINDECDEPAVYAGRDR